jgi:uncharacterized phiE125 gp8 family phage protein
MDDLRIHYSRTTGPASEPLTLDEAVRHLQLSVNGDNTYINSLIAVARDVAENATGQALLTSTWLAVCNDWPNSSGTLSIAVSPVTSITSVRYYAEGSATLTTVSSSLYTVSTNVTPAVITFSDDFTYPELANRPDAVQVVFVAGNATAATIAPGLKHALRILVRHYYDHPELIASGAYDELPFGLRHLLESNRVGGYCA